MCNCCLTLNCRIVVAAAPRETSPTSAWKKLLFGSRKKKKKTENGGGDERHGERGRGRIGEGGREGRAGNSIVFCSYLPTSKTYQPYRHGNNHGMGISLDLETPLFLLSTPNHTRCTHIKDFKVPPPPAVSCQPAPVCEK